MGGSSSSQNQTTHNNSLNQAIQGDNTGTVLTGDGNQVTNYTTDHGAIDAGVSVARDALGEAGRMFDSGGDLLLGVSDTLAGSNQAGFDLARDVNRDNQALLRDMGDLLGSASRDAFDHTQNMGDLMGDLSRDGMALAQGVITEQGDLARDFIREGGYLFEGMTDALAGGQADYMAAVENQTTQAYQFANHASRSDDYNLALESNKTMRYTAIAAAVALAVYALKKKG